MTWGQFLTLLWIHLEPGSMNVGALPSSMLCPQGLMIA